MQTINGTRYTQSDRLSRDQRADFAAALATDNPLMHLHALGYDVSNARVVDLPVAIRHTFPGGGHVGDGLVHAGDHYPQPVKPYAPADAEAAAAHMAKVNPGHSFEVVAYPEAVSA